MQLYRDLCFMYSLMHAYLEYLNIACHGQHDFMNEMDILSCHVFEWRQDGYNKNMLQFWAHDEGYENKWGGSKKSYK